MTIIDTAREGARQQDGRFGPQEHSAPEASLTIGEALSSLAVNVIRLDAPIGATTATVELDETTGGLVFSRYVDRNGRTLTTDTREDIDDALLGASVEAFIAEYDVTERIQAGERLFDVDLTG